MDQATTKTICANSSPCDDREMNILQVAGIIAEQWLRDSTDLPINEWANDVNDDGWGFDCRYPEEEYVGDSWTRVEDLILDDDDLAVAVALARNILDRKWYAVVEMPAA